MTGDEDLDPEVSPERLAQRERMRAWADSVIDRITPVAPKPVKP